MYSTSSEGGVTLQLRDADDFAAAGDDKGGLASVLARLQEDAALSISYQADSEALGLAGTEESLDHFLLGSTSSGTCLTTSGNGESHLLLDCRNVKSYNLCHYYNFSRKILFESLATM